MRKLLEEYISKLEMEDLEKRLELLRDRLSDKIDPKLIVKLVREDRGTR